MDTEESSTETVGTTLETTTPASDAEFEETFMDHYVRNQLSIDSGRDAMEKAEYDSNGVHHSERGFVRDWDMQEARYRGTGYEGQGVVDTTNLGVSNTTITIKSETASEIDKLRANIEEQRRNGTRVETASFMFGHHDKDGNIVIDEVVSDQVTYQKHIAEYNRLMSIGQVTAARQVAEAANWEGNLEDLMNLYIQEKGNQDLVIISTHTHPSYGNDHDNQTMGNHFSQADINGYVELENNIRNAGYKSVQLLGAILNSDGDLNIVGVNDQTEALERYTNVKMSDGQAVRNYTRGNYR